MAERSIRLTTLAVWLVGTDRLNPHYTGPVGRRYDNSFVPCIWHGNKFCQMRITDKMTSLGLGGSAKCHDQKLGISITATGWKSGLSEFGTVIRQNVYLEKLEKLDGLNGGEGRKTINEDFRKRLSSFRIGQY